MRLVTVAVPDNDDAENAVRRVASTLRDGCNVLTIPLPPPIGMEQAMDVAVIVRDAQTKLGVLAALAQS